jgi:hypothetical protein
MVNLMGEDNFHVQIIPGKYITVREIIECNGNSIKSNSSSNSEISLGRSSESVDNEPYNVLNQNNCVINDTSPKSLGAIIHSNRSSSKGSKNSSSRCSSSSSGIKIVLILKFSNKIKE